MKDNEMREAFEEWAKSQKMSLIPFRMNAGYYQSNETQDAWIGWQAAWAHSPAMSVPGAIPGMTPEMIRRHLATHHGWMTSRQIAEVRDSFYALLAAQAPVSGVEKDNEIYRLKVKCNTYAKRLVNEGFDDVSWELTSGLFTTARSEVKHE